MLYLHLFSSFFHFRLYSTSRISDIAVPRFLFVIMPSRGWVATMFTTMPKTTVHTILQEIGIRALREYIYKHLPAPDFHSHDFTRNFERHFATQYIQMQGLYARKTTIEARNTTISSEIGKFLGRNRDLLQIEKGPKRISINMNGKKSAARIWHKISQS